MSGGYDAREQLNKTYRDRLVQMKDGNYFKIKEVCAWDFRSALIMVEYVEGDQGWVNIRTDKLKEAT
jgi:hypothetical protein